MLPVTLALPVDEPSASSTKPVRASAAKGASENADTEKAI
jgi:hypothetical protein